MGVVCPGLAFLKVGNSANAQLFILQYRLFIFIQLLEFDADKCSCFIINPQHACTRGL